MLKKTKLIFLLVFLFGCSNFEYVYENIDYRLNDIRNNTLLSISGDDSEELFGYLFGKISNNESGYVYELVAKSNKSLEASVIKTDATASKFKVTYNILYTLTNISKNCLILEKELVTTSAYDSRSAGYSFGTDLSEKNVSKKNIHSSVDKFLELVVSSELGLECKNEN